MAQHVYHWKHGWIPLTPGAALVKAKGNHNLAARYLADAHSSSAGINNRHDVAGALLRLGEVPRADRARAARQVKAAAVRHGATDLLPGSESTPPALRKIYGNRLQVADDTPATRKNLAEINKMPAHVHQALAEHFAGHPDGGIYVGDKMVPDLDNNQHLKGVQPRGHPAGSTWDTVPGAYGPQRRTVAVGNGPHGSISIALHESSHAVDDAIRARTGRLASDDPLFARIVDDINANGPTLNPYYEQYSNPGGYRSEAFAEGFAAYMDARAAGTDPEERVYEALVGFKRRPTSPEASRRRIRQLVDYFRSVDDSLARRYSSQRA
jgi:hypothetical protein